MSITLELPPPINEGLAQESERNGISEMDHAALLICLANAFKHDEPPTAFQQAVREFLSHRALDVEQVFSAFEDLVRACLDVRDVVALEAPLGKGKTRATLQHMLLRHWRSEAVHRPIDQSYDAVLSDTSPIDSLIQAKGRIARETAHENENIEPTEQVEALLAKWQSEDRTPLRSITPSRRGETPTRALFRKWELENAGRTDEERDAEDRLWEDIEASLKESAGELRLRRLG